MKKTISVLLCLIMLISLLPAAAADDDSCGGETAGLTGSAGANITQTGDGAGNAPAESMPDAAQCGEGTDGNTADDGETGEAADSGSGTPSETGSGEELPDVPSGEPDAETVEEERTEEADAEPSDEEIAGQADTLTATAEWTTPCAGSEMTFTVHAEGGSENCKYRFYAVTDGEMMLADVSLSRQEGIRDFISSNELHFTFMASGTYRVRFQVFDTDTNQNCFTDWYTIVIDDPAYPSVSALVSSIAAECRASCSGESEMALWLHDWLLDHADYDYTYTYCNAEGVLARGKGTCESYQRAYAKLLDAVGIENARVTGNAHTWNVVKINGSWVQIDPTWDDVGQSGRWWEYHFQYGLTDELMAAVHSDHTAAAGYECTSLDENYFIKTGKISAWTDPLESAIRTAVDAKQTAFTVTIDSSNVPADFWYSEQDYYDKYYTVMYTLAAYSLTGTTRTAADGDTATLTVTCTAPKELSFTVDYGTPCTAHDLTHVEAKAAKLSTDGNVEYWVCSVCGRYFLDEAATEETAADAVVIPHTGLDAPVITGAYNYADYIKVVWNAVDGAESYRLSYRKGNEDWVKVCDTTGTRVNITDLEDGAAYTFKVECRSKDGTKQMSEESNRMPQIRLLTPTATVTRFGRAGTADGSGFKVSWDATEGGSCYKVYYREKGGSWALYANYAKSNNTRFVNIKASMTNASTASGAKFPDLIIGHTYEFVVLTATSQAGITSGFPTSCTGYKF